MEAVVIILFVLVALSSAVIGRLWALVIPLLVWPVYFLGLDRDWWGYGMGDGWQLGAVAITGVSLISVAVCVGLRSLVKRRAIRLAPERAPD
jgi:hypothetical protein